MATLSMKPRQRFARNTSAGSESDHEESGHHTRASPGGRVWPTSDSPRAERTNPGGSKGAWPHRARVIAERFGVNPDTVDQHGTGWTPFRLKRRRGPRADSEKAADSFCGLPALLLPFARKTHHRLPALFYTPSSDEPVSAMSRKERADAQWLTRAGSKPEPCRSNRRQSMTRAKDEFAIPELPVLAELVRCR